MRRCVNGWFSSWCAFVLCLFITPLSVATQFEHDLAKFSYSDGQYRQSLLWLDQQPDSELKAKALLKLGLFDEARLIFNTLSVSDASTAQSTFWLEQAAIHFYSGQYQAAEQDLAHDLSALDGDSLAKYFYFRARFALINDDLSAFTAHRESLDNTSELQSFLAHHLIIYKINNHVLVAQDFADYHASLALYSGSMVLADRTFLAMGHAFQAQDNIRSAILAYDNVRPNSPFIHQALLGVGWALNDNAQFDLALEKFKQLQSIAPQFSANDDAVRGIAFAMQNLGNTLGAFNQLEQGLKGYADTREALTRLTPKYGVDGECLRLAISHRLPASCQSATSDLMALVASHRLTQARLQLSDLDALAQDHSTQLGELSIHRERLLERKMRVNQRVEQLPLATILAVIEQLTVERNAIQDTIDVAIVKNDTHWFLSGKYLIQQQAVDRLYTEMVALKRAGLRNIDSQRRVNFMQRTLWWHSKSNFAKNRASVDALLASLNQQIAQLEAIYQRFDHYVAVVNDIDDDLTRISALEQEYHLQQQALPALELAITTELSAVFVAHLNRKMSLLDDAVVNTKLSRIKLLDTRYRQQLAFDADNSSPLNRSFKSPTLVDLIRDYDELLTLTSQPAMVEQLRYRQAELVLSNNEIEQELGRPLLAGQQGYYDRSIAVYRDIINDYPGSENIEHLLYLLAKAYDLQGDIGASYVTIKRLNNDFPNNQYALELYFRSGEYLFSKQQYKLATKAYSHVVTQPNSPYYQTALYMMAWSHFKLDNGDETLEYFAQLLDISLPQAPTLFLDINTMPKGDRYLVSDALDIMSIVFSDSKAAERLQAHFADDGHRYYEYLVYETLAQRYLDDKRYRDRAQTYLTFVEHYPNHIKSPGYAVNAIASYQQGHFSSLADQAKKDFVARYGLTGEHWKSWLPERRLTVTHTLKAYLNDIGQDLYRRGAKAENSSDRHRLYGQAADVFLQYINTFNDDENIAFLYAESLYASGQYAAAIVEYERYAFAPQLGYQVIEAKRADAAYTALLAHRLLWNKAGKPAAVSATLSPREQSTLRFIASFKQDKRNLLVLEQLMNERFKAERYQATIESAQQVIARGELIGLDKMAAATTLMAHSQFKLGRFAMASSQYSNVLNGMSKTDKRYEQFTNNYAASLYEQAQRYVDQKDLIQAIEWLESVIEKTPTATLRKVAQFNVAQYLYQLEEFDRATSYLNDFRQRFSGDKLGRDIPSQIASIYEQQEDWGNAANEYLAIADSHQDIARQQQPLYLAASYFERDGQQAKALKNFRRHAHAYSRPFERAIEVRHKIIQLYVPLDKPRKRNFWLRALISTHDKAGSESTNRSLVLAAQSALDLAKQSQHEFNRAKLRLPLRRSLKVKTERLKHALTAYQKASSYQLAEVTTESTHQMAAIYQQLAKDLLDSQRPKNLDALAMEQYDILLEEQAYPFEEQAIAIYENNTKRSWTGAYDSWIKQSFAALADILPGRYNKAELVEDDPDVIY